MNQVRQADIADLLSLSPMTISRAVRAMGRSGEPLTDEAALALLAAGQINRLGHSWPLASEIARRFEAEIIYAARDPEHRAWIIFIDRPERSFQVACHSRSHLDSILAANPLSLVLSLHVPVGHALEQLEHLKAMKEAA